MALKNLENDLINEVDMGILKEKLKKIISQYREDIKAFLNLNKDKEIGKITVGSVFGGMRGLPVLFCDTSEILPEKGLLIRGIPIKELSEKIPEDIFWLMLTGELPTKVESQSFQEDLNKRAEKIPEYVFNVIDNIPLNSHPMTMLNCAIVLMEKESLFVKKYSEGLRKEDYWEPIYEDSLNIISWVPQIASYVYRRKYFNGRKVSHNFCFDWAYNFAKLLGVDDENGSFTKLLRLYTVIHSDNEGGNVSAHCCHCAGSSLSNPFYSVAAGLCGLAGPLHGLANQEVLKWILDLMEEFDEIPKEHQIIDYVEKTLKSGKVIPGYGHSILRVTDPRFEAFYEFGEKYCKNDPVYKTVALVFKVVPDILKKNPKIKDPYPNLDACSGALLYHFGIKEFNFYTVMFGVSRIFGMTAQLILSRGFGEPIESPKSMTLKWFKEQVVK